MFDLKNCLAATADRAGQRVLTRNRQTLVRRLASGLLVGALLLSSMTTPSCGAESRSINELIADLKGSDLQARREAAWDLGPYGEAAAPAVDALAAAVADRDEQVCNGALQSLGQIGPAAAAAIPMIAKRMDDNDPQRRYRAAYALGHVAPPEHPVFDEGLNSRSSRQRAATVQALGWLGERAVPHAEALLRLLPDTDADVSQELTQAFRQMGPGVVAPLTGILDTRLGPEASQDEQDSWVRSQRRAAEILGDLGPIASAACPAILRTAESKDASLRGTSLIALARIACNSDRVEAELLSGLSAEEPEVRSAAISAIIQHPRRPASAIPLLIGLLDGDPTIANLATFALGRFGDVVQPSLPQLVARMNSQNETAIMNTISQLGPVTIAPLVQSVTEKSLSVEKAAEIIANIGFRAEAPLRELLAAGKAHERSVACVGLGRLGVAQDELVQHIDDVDASVRAAAIRGLAYFGAAAQPHAGRVAAHIADENGEVRAAALATLLKLESPLAQWADSLNQALTDPLPQVRAQAASCLGSLESPAEVTISALATAVTEPDVQVRAAAAEALGRLGQKAVAATPALVQATRDGETEVVRAAAAALAATQPTDPAVIQALTALVEHPSTDIRLSAIAAIGNAGAGASDARPRLEALLSDPSAEIRTAAIVALASSLPIDEQLQLLTRSLDDADWAVRHRVLELIGDLKDQARPAVPHLLSMLHDKDDSETVNLVLRRIDAAPPEAVPLLLDLLRSDRTDRRQQFFALYLIRKVKPAAKDALPILREMKADSEGRIADYLDRAIQEIESAE